MIRIILLSTALLLCSGCASQMRTPLLDFDGALTLPWVSGRSQQVVYPAGRQGRDDLSSLYGPAWRDIGEEYPEYRFN